MPHHRHILNFRRNLMQTPHLIREIGKYIELLESLIIRISAVIILIAIFIEISYNLFNYPRSPDG